MFMYNDIDLVALGEVCENAWEAFLVFKRTQVSQRASLMRAIAIALEETGDELIAVAMKETNLPEARLRAERGRTIFQLQQYADACEKGDWLEIRIDTAIPDKNPPKPDIRKMLVPLGPVAVFGASNFPFAYSTAGGDTACALAAGCPVIVKAHPAHEETSTIVAQAIQKAVEKCGMPKNIFAHVYGKSFEVGKALVTNHRIKAVGFTGSYGGGKQLFDWANQRPEPIPVFAEMGSVNPVFILNEKLEHEYATVAQQYAGSITLGVGQFCTNPGLLFATKCPGLDEFKLALAAAIKEINPGTMLHPGIAKAYKSRREVALSQPSVSLMAESSTAPNEGQGQPTVATVSGEQFLANPLLHQEVFGPYSLLVECDDTTQMLQIARQLEGQLTATIMGTETDLKSNINLIEAVKNICGRIILNGVPTGVEVCLSMHHGGPFPSTTDARFTSVGADGIKRFARPLSFQNWSNSLLPEALKNENPLHMWRTVNNQLTQSAI